MDKMKMQTPNLTQSNIQKIGEMFPNCITEAADENGKIKKAINFDTLKQMLSEDAIEGSEAYEFTWVGKRACIAEANKSINKTLRPCKEESVNWDTTQNLYIEGDNLEALKLLQESYLGKVKMIYIDPPYNTGSDFIYRDDFAVSDEEYAEDIGQYDEYGNRLFVNTESNGKYHSDWCSMIYPRLLVARNLLADDGVVFISIGKGESHNLIKICDEIYGVDNRVGIISRMMKSGGNKGQYFSPNIEHILVYAKEIIKLDYFREPLSEEIKRTYNHIETEGARQGESFTIKGLCQPGLGIRPNQRYWIEAPDGSFLIPRGENFPSVIKEGEKIIPSREDTCWKWTYDRYVTEKNKGNIYFSRSVSASALVDETGATAKWNVFNKIWLSDRQDEGRVPVDLITKWENRLSSEELKELNIPFDFAKPTKLIQYLMTIVKMSKDDIVLDFFSGSATTAHAVMQLNAEDGGNRKFIMVQIPEPCDETSEAYKAGFKNICEIGKERIRRAGQKIKEENGITTQNLDIGFRVFKVDEGNMNKVYYSAGEYTQDLLESLESNIKPDRTDLDLLFGCLVDWGLPLSMPYTSEVIDGCTVHTYNGGDLIACFNENIPKSVVVEIAKRKPLRAVFRDSGFADSPAKINVFEIFKLYMPESGIEIEKRVKVI